MPPRGRGRGHGRGPGRGRGRGASRGRGGRGRGPGRNITGIENSDEWTLDKQTGEAEAMNINKDAGQFFTGKATFEQHYDAQQENKERYAAALTVMHRNGVEISPSKFVRMFLCVVEYFFFYKKFYYNGSQLSIIYNVDNLYTFLQIRVCELWQLPGHARTMISQTRSYQTGKCSDL